MAHDFKRFPELTNSQMAFYYFDSPHQQIAEDFWAKVVKVTDGDTIRVTCDFRDFNFPIRFANIMAAELSENGHASRDHLKRLIENAEVEIIIDKTNRVGKYGRLIGRVQHKGFDVGEEMIAAGKAIGVWQEQMGIKPLQIILDL